MTKSIIDKTPTNNKKVFHNHTYTSENRIKYLPKIREASIKAKQIIIQLNSFNTVTGNHYNICGVLFYSTE